VDVHPLIVERQLKHGRKQSERKLGWFSASDAESLMDQEELADLIRHSPVRLSPNDREGK
jgi:hypothetical protein